MELQCPPPIAPRVFLSPQGRTRTLLQTFQRHTVPPEASLLLFKVLKRLTLDLGRGSAFSWQAWVPTLRSASCEANELHMLPSQGSPSLVGDNRDISHTGVRFHVMGIMHTRAGSW